MDKRYLALGAGLGVGVIGIFALTRRRRSPLGSVGIAPPTPAKILVEQRERAESEGARKRDLPPVTPAARWREMRKTIPPEKRGRRAKPDPSFVPEEYEAFITPMQPGPKHGDHKLQEELIGYFTVDRRKFVKQLVPRRFPDHLVPYAEFMVKSSQRPVTPRTLVKAYLMTTGSMMRSALKPATVLEHVPYAKVGAQKIRPEDVLGQVLRSEAGKAYLDAAAQGRYNARAASVIQRQYGWTGLDEKFANQLRLAPALALKTDQVNKILRSNKPGTRRAWYNFVKKNMSGIKIAKAGFVASMLGRGDMATADAREANFWFCPPGKYDTTKRKCSISMQARYGDKWTDQIGPETVEVLREQLNNIPVQMPRKYQPFRTHLAHHLLWEALEGQPTTHQDIVNAVQLAGHR